MSGNAKWSHTKIILLLIRRSTGTTSIWPPCAVRVSSSLSFFSLASAKEST